MLNPDFRDMLSALSDAGAEYLVVGAYALAAHGVPRATGDLDLWVRPSAENAPRVLRALASFGAPMDQITEADLAAQDTVFQLGLVPRRIDLLTSLTALEFEGAWERRVEIELEGLQVPVLGREELLANKSALGRPQDLADVDALSKEPPRTKR